MMLRRKLFAGLALLLFPAAIQAEREAPLVFHGDEFADAYNLWANAMKNLSPYSPNYKNELKRLFVAFEVDKHYVRVRKEILGE